ncbi:MAG: GntR family transcriptional regulator [Peptococcaceae bacterium]|nr:GntR family transcriptional regulator [Peptococcaceae bacterium]
MELVISSSSHRPIYEQITAQIKALIIGGKLSEGDHLPSMRALAQELHVSVITVQHAYEELQREGFIETNVGRGSFVAAYNKMLWQAEQERCADAHLQAAAEIGRTNGMSLDVLQKKLGLFYKGDGCNE